MKRLIALLGMVALAACAQPAKVENFVPAAQGYAYPSLQGEAAAGPLPDEWYVSAVENDLADLLATAKVENPAINIEARRVDQARANMQAAEANRWFDVVLNASASADYDIDSGDTDDASRASLGLSLPLDINGRLRLQRNAARYRFFAAEANYDQVRNTTLRDLSISVVDAAEADLLYNLVEAQIENSETLLTLTELRFAQGQASIVDVLQQRDQIASLEQQLPPLRASRTAAIDRIATATGNPPVPDDMPAFSSDIPQIIPVDAYPQADMLLTTRPDLRTSVYSLEAANAAYTAALVDRLPSFNLSSSAVTDLASGNAGDFVTATVSGALTVFDSGAKSAAINLTRAQYEERGISLLQDWLDALAEINNLINLERQGLENIRLTEERLETSRQLLESARRRYRQGASDYLPVLNALSSIQTQERRLISLNAEQARIRLRLHAALGLPQEQGLAGDTERTI